MDRPRDRIVGAAADLFFRKGIRATGVDTLIEHDFERGSTAAALPVHRNTLRDRLRRIGDLTGVEFDTASGQAQAWLAYRARRVGA